ncbi:5-aminolevulinate synthase [Polaromonas vacuolata]|uniref:5-aminolevulinate synthase n=1 Tax=Polaromonas vacuolata TaxID=37448 RepID=A0A6H2HBE2_9BURK|nr:aminotransferase class I/II-fold pyridoxal phosphate-dependent enzyme [Polaromonas vacuolata]QJC57113.1 5-aminolevulinate synthase [Polaromonas vacuolata]
MYSMFGDFSPLPALVLMLEKYPKLHLYLDDAHGMSWTDPRGTGYVFQYIANHPRVVFCISQAKGFGAGGGVFLIADPKMRDLVRTLGQTMIFSGPIQIPVLGAAIAFANLHLSGEVELLQKDLSAKLELAEIKCREYGLPLVSKGLIPIFFIGIGTTPLAIAVCKQLKDANFLVNVAAYPAVPPGRSGLRISINASHTAAEITNLFDNIGQLLPKYLKAENSSMAKVASDFGCANLG